MSGLWMWGFRTGLGRLLGKLAHFVGHPSEHPYFGQIAHVNGKGPCERCVGMSVQGAEEL